MEQVFETLSIIVPTYRRPKQLSVLLKSIHDQSFDKNKYQILVVSNLKDKKTKEICTSWTDKFYDLKYFEVGLRGVNLARNMGIRFSGCDVLYFVDDDCVIDNKDHLSHLLDLHNQRLDLAGIGGGYKPLYSKKIRPYEWVYIKGQQNWMKRVSSKDESQQLIGGNASYKLDVFKKGFRFNSQIVFGGSEVGFNNDLRKFGYKLGSFPSLDISHKPHVSIFSFLRKSFKQGQGYWINLISENQGQRKGLLETHKFIFPKSEREVLSEARGLQKFYWYLYHLFFKLGFWWESGQDKGLAIRWVRLVKFILASWFYDSKLMKPYYFCKFQFEKRVLDSKLMKPYYFCKFQFEKRVLKRKK